MAMGNTAVGSVGGDVRVCVLVCLSQCVYATVRE